LFLLCFAMIQQVFMNLSFPEDLLLLLLHLLEASRSLFFIVEVLSLTEKSFVSK
jgi:hypothetical protein